jgi:hypothetical protein
MVSEHVSIRPRQRLLDPFRFHGRLDAGFSFLGEMCDSFIRLALTQCEQSFGTIHEIRGPTFAAQYGTAEFARSEAVLELFRRDLMPDQNRYWKVSLRTLPAQCKPIFDPSRMS